MFVTDLESFPPRHEYLIIKDVKERVGPSFTEIDVLAQVNKIINYSDILGSTLSLQELEAIIDRYDGGSKVYGEAKILGYIDDDGVVKLPRSAAVPGQEVYIAPSEQLERFFTKEIEAGVEIGGLISREEVRVKLDPNGFRRHLAVIAQTGAGKSYLVGLIIENLLPLGATIVVIDPNSDYVMLRRNRNGGPTEISEDVTIYRPPEIKGRRYGDEEIGGSLDYTIDFSALTSDQISDVAGISSNWNVIREAVEKAVEKLSGTYYPEQLEKKLVETSNSPDKRASQAATRALTYIRRLRGYRIWGNKDISLEDLVKPRSLSVIDLAGLQRNVSDYIVNKTLEDVWSQAITGKLDYPIFVVLEEAHNFAPGTGRYGGMASYIIDQIASEGRKFGIFLLVVTQRPNKISQNVLSQCNSQIIMRLTNPEDMSAVRRSSERLSEELFQDLPGLNRGEAIVVGELTKVPTMVKVSGRVSEEGGSDIDVIAAFKKAQKIYELNKHTEIAPPEEEEEPRSKW
jgi:hypothetical protein